MQFFDGFFFDRIGEASLPMFTTVFFPVHC
jgi:hypothetical protein